jgi:hypothetical protein
MLVRNAQDILCGLGFAADEPSAGADNALYIEDLSAGERTVYGALDTPMSHSELIQKLIAGVNRNSLKTNEITVAISLLEMKKIIVTHDGVLRRIR